MRVFIVDAFTDKMFMGNPAGVVLDCDHLSTEEMQTIAREMNVSETVFVLSSSSAHFQLRYFTPTVEINFCGHATIASSFIIGKIFEYFNKVDKLIVETNIGKLVIDWGLESSVYITLPKAEYKEFKGDMDELVRIFNLENQVKNVWLGSSGSWDLFIGVGNRRSIEELKPNLQLLKEHNLKHDIGSVHLYSMSDEKEEYLLFTRNFGPAVGIDEDFVTGSSNGVLVGYLLKHHQLIKKEFIIQQGNPLIRMGKLYIKIDENTIKLGGRAVIVLEGNID